jgi:hypothetical protein
MRSLSVLMVAPQPFFSPRGTPISVLQRLKALSELGYQVDLLTYPVGEDIKMDGLTIHRMPYAFSRTVRVGPSLTKLLLDVCLFCQALLLLRRRRYDVIHSHEEAAYFGIILAKVFRTRHVYDMHSSLPHQLRNFSAWSWKPLCALAAFLERHTVKRSDAVITICPDLQRIALEIGGPRPPVLIENVFDTDRFFAEARHG